jgi:hypothetical protein
MLVNVATPRHDFGHHGCDPPLDVVGGGGGTSLRAEHRDSQQGGQGNEHDAVERHEAPPSVVCKVS